MRRKQKNRHTKLNKIFRQSFYIGYSDRITRVYECTPQGEYVKVVNVSYEIMVDNKWHLVSRYDSEHGYLHCHMRTSLKDPTEILLDRSPVIKKGNPKDWLTWAIHDFQKHFFEYRKGFLKRSGTKEIY
jgi:hypothetical protein